MKTINKLILNILLASLILTSCSSNSNENNDKKIEDSNSNEFKIISYLKMEDIIIMAGPVMNYDYAVLQISSNSIKGFLGWASQGSAEYFISGTLSNDSYVGDVFYLESDSVIGKFKLKIADEKLKLIGDCSFDNDKVGIPIYNGLHYFDGSTITGVLIEPTIKSKELIPIDEITNNDKMGATILEIGKHENINGQFNLWYKVKINNTIGWVFGGLCTVCANENPSTQDVSSPKEDSKNQNIDNNEASLTKNFNEIQLTLMDASLKKAKIYLGEPDKKEYFFGHLSKGFAIYFNKVSNQNGKPKHLVLFLRMKGNQWGNDAEIAEIYSVEDNQKACFGIHCLKIADGKVSTNAANLGY